MPKLAFLLPSLNTADVKTYDMTMEMVWVDVDLQSKLSSDFLNHIATLKTTPATTLQEKGVIRRNPENSELNHVILTEVTDEEYDNAVNNSGFSHDKITNAFDPFRLLGLSYEFQDEYSPLRYGYADRMDSDRGTGFNFSDSGLATDQVGHVSDIAKIIVPSFYNGADTVGTFAILDVDFGDFIRLRYNFHTGAGDIVARLDYEIDMSQCDSSYELKVYVGTNESNLTLVQTVPLDDYGFFSTGDMVNLQRPETLDDPNTTVWIEQKSGCGGDICDGNQGLLRSLDFEGAVTTEGGVDWIDYAKAIKDTIQNFVANADVTLGTYDEYNLQLVLTTFPQSISSGQYLHSGATNKQWLGEFDWDNLTQTDADYFATVFEECAWGLNQGQFIDCSLHTGFVFRFPVYASLGISSCDLRVSVNFIPKVSPVLENKHQWEGNWYTTDSPADSFQKWANDNLVPAVNSYESYINGISGETNMIDMSIMLETTSVYFTSPAHPFSLTNATDFDQFAHSLGNEAWDHDIRLEGFGSNTIISRSHKQARLENGTGANVTFQLRYTGGNPSVTKRYPMYVIQTDGTVAELGATEDYQKVIYNSELSFAKLNTSGTYDQWQAFENSYALERFDAGCTIDPTKFIFNTCPICVNDRFKIGMKAISIPESAEPEEERGVKKCCQSWRVFANPNDYTDEKTNDYKGLFYQRQDPSDTCSFIMTEVSTGTEYDLETMSWAEVHDFGTLDNVDVKVVKFSWSDVYQQFGQGNYMVRRDFNINGITGTLENVNYYLTSYSISKADRTARIESVMTGFVEEYEVDFRTYRFSDMVRVGGFFGNRKPQYNEQRTLYNASRKEAQIRNELINLYEFETVNIPECMTYPILNWHLLANELYLSDYNRLNHSYKFNRTPVYVDAVADPEYFGTQREAVLRVTFRDLHRNKRKRNC